MRKLPIVVCAFIVLGCAPATPTAVPTAVPTSTLTAIVENPPPCWGADLIYHPQLQKMLLVNCVTDPSQESPLTIWGWDGTQWERVTRGGPPGRILGGAAYDEKRNVLVLYGGRPAELGACSQETWEWDGQDWSMKDAAPPTACDHVKMVYDSANGESILFSGLDPDEQPVNETWSWNGEEWKLLSEEGPESRGHFGFVHDPNHKQTLLYGGYTNSATDEFWVWKDGAWEEIDFPGPGTRSHFGMTYDTTDNTLFLFGGATSRSTFSSLSNDTWILSGGRWQELSPASSPSERGSPSLGYDPVRQRIILHGGFAAANHDLDDTWEWDGENWDCRVNCN